ncbi:hypothetical protein LCL87_08545 [Rhodococcus hoagii]|nr:hypothetical protein [Prescottella equi]
MDGLEYWFGTGDGATSMWTSPADLDIDGDGGFDAVRLDFDGDGLLDDAMWDSDDDGVADRVVLDVGAPEARYFTDPARNGVWGQQVSAPTVVDDPREWGRVDFDDDGARDDEIVDRDRDGTPDYVLVAARDSSRYDTLLVPEEEPGRMSVRLSDTDGDGRLDTVRREGV